MADLKISQLTDGGASQAADEYVIARSGSNFRIDGASVAAAATSVGTLTSLTVSGDLTVDTNTLKVDSTNNRVGVGTASPSQLFEVKGGSFSMFMTGNDLQFNRAGTAYITATGAGSTLDFGTANTTGRMLLDASGNLGLGVTPSYQFDLLTPTSATDRQAVRINYGTTVGRAVYFGIDAAVTGTTYIQSATPSSVSSGTDLALNPKGGNVGVGTASPGYRLNVNAKNPGNGVVAQFYNDQTSSPNGSFVLVTQFGVADWFIGQPSATNALTFGNGKTSSTAGTEYARITSDGWLLVGKTAQDLATQGSGLLPTGRAYFTSNADDVVLINRLTNDGALVTFYQDTITEGTISVSGNTVSYNAFAGSHWSQLEDGSKPEILRGTVMEALNELCEWPGEQNERLPKAKVSDTAGSKKVYGVFMAWDNDWTVTNDMYVTAVGAFVCRVAADVVVEQGDLLESNGDGTARVQADDVIRSSTIGKVTSTVKTHEYEDGTYCVPTVLYCG